MSFSQHRVSIVARYNGEKTKSVLSMLDQSRQRENSAIEKWALTNDVLLYSSLGAGLVSVLAANTPSSINMVFGERAALWVNYIMRALDINSRVVFNVDNPEHAQSLREILRGDLRYTVHSQDSMSFIDDIRRYQIALFIIDMDMGESVFHQALTLLDNAGYIVILGDDMPSWDFKTLEVASWRLGNCTVTFLTREPALAMPRTRKGGRREAGRREVGRREVGRHELGRRETGRR